MKLFRSSQQRKYDRLVRSLPLNNPIFLPTESFPLTDAISGLERVKNLYDEGLDTTHRPKLNKLRQQYEGVERCFVIGNGPSLNQTDLTLLGQEVTFAVNGFFLKAADLAWSPTFYVVEDHLVAEDRMEEIRAIAGSKKLFPANLAYCLDETDDTIFFDHRPRVSYPNRFDFSTDAESTTYAGCTVTFTCLQLAVYFGFRKIYLIGVDADYSIPSDAAKSDSYGTQILDMCSDDPNHFDPNYFGKGYRWHDPQVEKMLEAYREAKRVTDQLGVRIFNAGIGGKVEVFPRVNYTQLFEDLLNPSNLPEIEPIQDTNRYRDPRLAIIDATLMGDGTATGELKANLFENWRSDHLFHIYSGDRERIAARGDIGGKPINSTNIPASNAFELLAHFNPECVIYRPVPENAALHDFAMHYIRRVPVPLICWIMDDWPARLRHVADPVYEKLKVDFRWLLERASVRLCISDGMAAEFGRRYRFEFETLANGVDPDQWPLPLEREEPNFVIRYSGALADNMAFGSVIRVARAIEALAQDGLPIHFEINTRPLWANAARREIGNLASCSIATKQYSQSEYRDYLQSADALLIAYNFDERSKAYIGYSLANKLPECLISGRPVLVHGPADIATVDVVARNVPDAVVSTPDEAILRAWLRELHKSAEKRRELATACRSFAISNFGIDERRQKLSSHVTEAIETPYRHTIRYYEREEQVNLDETAVINVMTQQKVGPDFVMLDIGAHHGSSARQFASRGWTIFAFEPDPRNAKPLSEIFENYDNVTVDTRAVSDAPGARQPFYTSEVSNGISSMHAFHESHSPAGMVGVTSITEVVDQYEIDRVDFLKIDVEGLDFAVLKGVPWNKLTPAIIVCEFEDNKTLSLGHTWQDIADFLEFQGYVVYVSEWYPIERYGIRHQWRSLREYPCELADTAAWGNLLAFRDARSIDEWDGALRQSIDGSDGFPNPPGAAIRRLFQLILRTAGWMSRHLLRRSY